MTAFALTLAPAVARAGSPASDRTVADAGSPAPDRPGATTPATGSSAAGATPAHAASPAAAPPAVHPLTGHFDFSRDKIVAYAPASPAGAGPTAVEARASHRAGAASVELTGESAVALPGLARVGAAGLLDRGLVAAVQAGYGYTGAVLGMHDAHHRARLKLAATVRPFSWLAVGASFDERYDVHSGDAGSDSGWVGDPRLLEQISWQAAPDWGIGGRATLWLPGENAPSIDFNAATLDLVGLASYAPPGRALSLHFNGGFRVDNSAASVPDPSALSAADRLALGVSAANAFLFGAGAAWRMGAGELYAEWSWDLYFGVHAPPVIDTPMRVDAGGCIPIGGRYDAFGTVEVDTSGRPGVGPMQPLVPIEPRVSVLVGLTARFVIGGGRRVPPAPPAPGIVEGRVQTPDGAPVAGAEVDVGGARATAAADGRFEIRGVVAGRRDVTATADGYRAASSVVAVEPAQRADVTLTLARKLPPGQVRGVVQSFAGKPLRARIRIEPSGVWVQTDKMGSFSADLAPGSYEVIVTAKGYSEQRSKIRIEENGVTILNVDMRRRR